jgi:hypothetical protein
VRTAQGTYGKNFVRECFDLNGYTFHKKCLKLKKDICNVDFFKITYVYTLLVAVMSQLNCFKRKYSRKMSQKNSKEIDINNAHRPSCLYQFMCSAWENAN